MDLYRRAWGAWIEAAEETMEQELVTGVRVMFVPKWVKGTLVKRCLGLPKDEALGRSYWVQIDGEEEGTHLLCLESELVTVEG